MKSKDDTDFAATRADLTARIIEKRKAAGETAAVSVAEAQLRRGDGLAEEERSASSIAYYDVGQTVLKLSDDADFGRNLRSRSKDGADQTNSAGKIRHQQLLDRIRLHVLDRTRIHPKIKNPQIIQHLQDHHADLCRFDRADGSTKSYEHSTLDKAVRKIRKES